ncbi:endonuclease/exonuclease/phosphatase family protein [Alistipes sp.]|uniref:endonuclease/exonuclease/phosphatase family protein n=1 Tax=Alistipes sp. TaxID=1872444 RepID=UPI003AF0EA1D
MTKKSIFLLLLLFAVRMLPAQELTVASYNVRNANDSDRAAGNGWEQRSPWLCGLIRFVDFDIFGSQEVLHKQLGDMLELLPGYKYIGVGRTDGREDGEYAPIFYKAERFELLDEGNFWLSETPEKPSRGWDAALPRICTWGHFLDRRSGKRFWFFNLHMDHIGVQARHNGAELVMRQIAAMCSPGEAVILTGDFNVDQTDEIYGIFTASGQLRDSYEVAAQRYAPNGTFNDFKTELKTDSRIDHIFVSAPVAVFNYGILTETYRSPVADSDKRIKSGNFPEQVALHSYQSRVPSDHFPVVARISLGE